MYNKKRILAIIPARGGSKRIPKKNIKLLDNKPLIWYSIKAAMKSKFIKKIIVSSDNSEILKIAKNIGAETIKRPSNISGDKAKTITTLKHVVKTVEKEGFKPDILVLLQATSPLRNSKHIDEAIKKFIKQKADTVIGVTKRDLYPNWILKKESNGQVKFIIKNNFNKIRSQNQSETYEINGAIYVISRNVLKNSKDYAIGKKIYPYVMKKIHSFDIDEIEDFMIVESIMKRLKTKLKQ